MLSESKTRYLVVGLLVLVVLLRFWGITSLEVQHDMALNSVRALGWFDFLIGEGQTSPIVWLGSIPWWGNLSFHDHPPLVFFLQHLTFIFFGDNNLGAFLPFLLASLGTAVALYIFTSRLSTRRVGVLALIFFAVSSYALWVARSGYLEGVQMIFVILSFFTFLFFVEKPSLKSALVWSALTAFCVLSKYTSIFLLAAELFFILLWTRPILKNRNFWLGVALFFILLTPIIIFNAQVFALRGHFDAAFSSMLGMHPEDYAVIAQRGLSSDFLTNFYTIFQTLQKNSSWPFFLISTLSIVWVIYRALKKDTPPLVRLLGLSWLMVFLTFSLSGASTRFLSVTVPLTALSLGLTANYFWDKIADHAHLRRIVGFGLTFIFLAELLFSINTNLTPLPYGQEGLFYAPERFYLKGFNDLDKFFREAGVLLPAPAKRKIEHVSDMDSILLHGRDAVIFDDRADWFSEMWYLKRYTFYSETPIVALSDLMIVASLQGSDPLLDLKNAGLERFWYVQTAPAGIGDYEFEENFSTSLTNIEESLNLSTTEPVAEFKNVQGQTVFRVFRFEFQQVAS